MPDATNSTLQLASISASHAGNYRLIASNSLGSATSSVAQISVVVNLSNPSVVSQIFRANVVTLTNRIFKAEFKNSLSETNWSLLSSLTGDGTMRVINDPFATNTQRFYRVRVE